MILNECCCSLLPTYIIYVKRKKKKETFTYKTFICIKRKKITRNKESDVNQWSFKASGSINEIIV